MSLKEILFADLLRQYAVAGKSNKRPNWAGLIVNFFSPRFMPVVIYRLSHWCYKHRLYVFSKCFSLLNFVVFGLEIAVKCEIGKGLYFPHTQGTVIGCNSIGENATIYHNVTFGAREIDLTYSSGMRPSLGDNVIVGAGAKVLGGIHVGNNARIAANSLVLEDVPPGATVGCAPAKIIKQREHI